MSPERMGTGIGYGKVILFNEHFVVHGIPAIAGSMGDHTRCTVTTGEGTGWSLQDERPETPGYKTQKMDEQRQSISNIFACLGLDASKEPVHIQLDGSLQCASGLGASGASCTALARALNDYFDLGKGDVAINQAAYEGEKGYHGTPSGLDNTVSTYGGLLHYTKGKPSKFDPIAIKEPVGIVLGNTGQVADTVRAVAGVRERKESEPEVYGALFETARVIGQEGRKAIEAYDLVRVGALMNINHHLLQAIGVSSPELDELVVTARVCGALGAKVTGGGLGGNMVALTPTKELQNEVADAMEQSGYSTIRTTIGVKGEA